MKIGYNEDLTTAILLRLPVKSVLRLKIVSKQWLSIVSSPQFRQIHAASDTATSTGIFFNKDKALEFLSLDNHTFPILHSDQPMRILSSSGGLLLLLRSGDYYICNPATNEIKSLAAVPQFIRESKTMVACLAFDPSESLNYKVLFVYCLNNSVHYKLQSLIYSSETRTFRSLETTNLIHLPHNGIYWNDAIHWTAYRWQRSIVYFDLSKECMNVHRLPVSVSGYPSYIDEHQGHLLVVTFDIDDENFRRKFSVIRVYESKRDYSGWSLKYKLEPASLGIQFPSTPISDTLFMVFGVLVDEEQDLSVVIMLRDYTFVACNLKKKLCNVLGTNARPSIKNIGYTMRRLLAYNNLVAINSGYSTHWIFVFLSTSYE